MKIEEKIALVKEHKKDLKGQEFKVDEARVPVKVVGMGDKALKVLVLEGSKFHAKPVWKQSWINYTADIIEGGAPRAIMLINEMVKAISQTTL